MAKLTRVTLVASAALIALGLSGSVDAQQNNMTFFITSSGSGKGANLGGLSGADQHCQMLAKAAGRASLRPRVVSRQTPFTNPFAKLLKTQESTSRRENSAP